jgi:hypothetical protein
MVPPSLASKPVAWVSQFIPQNWQLRFGDLDLKITMNVFGLDLKTKRASVRRLYHKIDGGRFGLKTSECVTTGGARGIIAEVTSR